MLHSRRLQVLSPCDSFAGTPARGDRPAHCTNCAKDVHDLSRMSEREVLRFAARHVGEELCVSYRVRDDGSVITHERARALAPAALALSLTGCAGHLGSGGETREGCVDAQGYTVDCPPASRLGVAVIPGVATEETIGELGEDDETFTPEGVDDDADPDDALRFGDRLASTPSLDRDADIRAPSADQAAAAVAPAIAEETTSCGIHPAALEDAFWSRVRVLRMGKIRVPSAEELCADPDMRRRAERIERRAHARAARRAARGR